VLEAGGREAGVGEHLRLLVGDPDRDGTRRRRRGERGDDQYPQR
jgi:hypothetical protein